MSKHFWRNLVNGLLEEVVRLVYAPLKTNYSTFSSTLNVIQPLTQASILFDIDRSQAHHWVHRLQPILEAALGEKKALPERQINCVQAFIERFPGVERVIMDGTERPVQRPTHPEKQKLNYSGKKKRHRCANI
ncbi:transposase family protein [Okeania sp. SIO1I7]|uniref:transposase family protein n=1 Tax=Okeania sp. SIO1I7 TaxID=2607772 RepID=UPI0025F2A8EE|nr:transposase family protein [Okeania sp. SIO1I7]